LKDSYKRCTRSHLESHLPPPSSTLAGSQHMFSTMASPEWLQPEGPPHPAAAANLALAAFQPAPVLHCMLH
jgi:hypothetical protein